MDKSQGHSSDSAQPQTVQMCLFQPCLAYFVKSHVLNSTLTDYRRTPPGEHRGVFNAFELNLNLYLKKSLHVQKVNLDLIALFFK